MIVAFKLVGQSGSFNDEWRREYTELFEVHADSQLDKPPEIWSHPRCPVPGRTRAEFDNLAICTQADPVYRKRTRYIWDLTVKYSTVRTTPYVPGENPLDDPADVVVDSEISLEDRYSDLDGLPNTNEAGDLVPVKLPVCRVKFQIRKNVDIVNGWLSKVSGVVNDTPVRLKGESYPRGTLQVWSVRLGNVEFKNNYEFFVCDLVIKHKEEGWLTSYLNAGYNELVLHPQNRGQEPKLLYPGTNKPVMVKQRCLDGPDGMSGDPVTSPVMLDENGSRPRVKTTLDGKELILIKNPLELSDIQMLKRRYVTYLDFNQYLPIR